MSEIATITVLNQKKEPVVNAAVTVLDSVNAVAASGVTDVDGKFAPTLASSPLGVAYRVIVQKLGVACGNSLPILVVDVA